MREIRLNYDDHRDLAKRIKNHQRSLDFMIQKLRRIYGPDCRMVKDVKRARRALADLANELDGYLSRDFGEVGNGIYF